MIMPARHSVDLEAINPLSKRRKDINAISSREPEAGRRGRKARASAGKERPVCQQSNNRTARSQKAKRLLAGKEMRYASQTGSETA